MKNAWRTWGSLLGCVGLALHVGATESRDAAERVFDIGAPGDEAVIGRGVYGREGPNPQAKHAFYRENTFRWFSGTWTLKLPVVPGRPHAITIRAKFQRTMRLTVGDNTTFLVEGLGDRQYGYTFYLPAATIGDRTEIEVQGACVPAYASPQDGRDRRELVMAVDEIRVRALDRLSEDAWAAQLLPSEPEPDLPLPFRLRGTESRPLFTDVESYVLQARQMRCNVMTIGPMNGCHYAAFASEKATPWRDMHPDFIPELIRGLHAHGIAAIGWLPFNVQDIHHAVDCQAARRHPEWQMRYLRWPGHPAGERVGMCVISSPWRQMHAQVLKEAVALGLDAAWFDGFYLEGIPHPGRPGCVCDSCRAAFRTETGLEAPAEVDWTSAAFKRWVRWRNRKLIEVANEFRDAMREVKPGLPVTCNYNAWPFGTKDWDTGIPLWSTTDYGVSQHAYTGRADLEWVMLGYKARLSHDLNPEQADIWRTSTPTWKYADTETDRARHELTLRTFMLGGLTYGVTPWHGGHILPADIGIRVHEAVRARERFFSQSEFRDIGVVVSQNTHDFHGHAPGTTHLEDYRDTVLGTWLLLTENHVTFRFLFDNQIEAGDLAGYRVVLLPDTACLSDRMAERLKQYVAAGGRLVTTGETGACDEWGDPRARNALADVSVAERMEGEPARAWLRERQTEAGSRLLAGLRLADAPLRVEAPRSLAVNAVWSPDRRALWIHLLNVSAFYPGGDTGFRGVEQKPVYSGDMASDGALALGERVSRVNTPATGVRVHVTGFKAARARLGVSGETLRREAKDGAFSLPEIPIHDVLVLESE